MTTETQKNYGRLGIKTILLLTGIAILGAFLFGDLGAVKTFRIFEEVFKATRGGIILLCVFIVGLYIFLELKKESGKSAS